MTEQMKLTIARSLEARITQCNEEMRMLAGGPAFDARHEHLAYWQGEKETAFAALAAVHRVGFGA
jgi:hypothetical protein